MWKDHLLHIPRYFKIPMSTISKQEVEHVACLARLSMSEEELDRVTIQLDAILSYAAKLDEVDVSGVAAQAKTKASLTTPLRDDVMRPSLTRENGLQNAAEHNGESFIVPQVIL